MKSRYRDSANRDFRTLALGLAGLLAFIPATSRGQNVDKIPSSSRRDHDVAADAIRQELEFQQGIVSHIRGDQDQALEHIEQIESESANQHYMKGILHLERGEIGEAEKALDAAAKLPDPPENTLVYLAIARLHGEDPLAAELALKSHLNSHPNDEYAKQLWNVAQSKQQPGNSTIRTASHQSNSPNTVGMNVSNQISDSSLLFDGPDRDPAHVSSADFASALRLPPDKWWNFSVLLATEYDSNTVQTPQIVGLGAISNKDDARFVVATFGDFLMIDRDTWNAGLVMSTFDTFHVDLTQFDLQDYMGGAYTNFQLGNAIAGVRYEFHETLVDYDHFAAEHRLVSSLSFLQEGGHTTFFHEWDSLSSHAPALIPAQIQSGDIQAVGATQAIYTGDGDGRIYLGYRFERAATIGTDFDRHTNMVTARIEQPLAGGWIGDTEFRYFWDDFDNPNSLDFFNRARSDTRLEVRAGLQKNFCDHQAFRVDYSYFSSNSNVENLFGVRFYEFDRHVVSTQLIYDF